MITIVLPNDESKEIERIKNFHELEDIVKTWDESMYNNIWCDGLLRRNVIVAVNEKIVNDNSIVDMTFNDGDLIEIMLQFAGG